MPTNIRYIPPRFAKWRCNRSSNYLQDETVTGGTWTTTVYLDGFQVQQDNGEVCALIPNCPCPCAGIHRQTGVEEHDLSRRNVLHRIRRRCKTHSFSLQLDRIPLLRLFTWQALLSRWVFCSNWDDKFSGILHWPIRCCRSEWSRIDLHLLHLWRPKFQMNTEFMCLTTGMHLFAIRCLHKIHNLLKIHAAGEARLSVHQRNMERICNGEVTFFWLFLFDGIPCNWLALTTLVWKSDWRTVFACMFLSNSWNLQSAKHCGTWQNSTAAISWHHFEYKDICTLKQQNLSHLEVWTVKRSVLSMCRQMFWMCTIEVDFYTTSFLCIVLALYGALSWFYCLNNTHNCCDHYG